eukprot:TRINITY_DN8291_c0_g1_i1.p1 TRINITY_DN8291_c0_g1~~TRINITY_DN8291_c0_g1_i1.p1  ORF type:complete len:560 (+),score=113.65 TRINITY_DN8291_c0_g1_i1:52-1731(+)
MLAHIRRPLPSLEFISGPPVIRHDPRAGKSRRRWNNRDQNIYFVHELEKKLNLKTWRDWYSISKQTIELYGGSGLLQRYNNSPSKMIMDLFPDHKWNVLEFHQVPSGFWRDGSHRKEFLHRLSKKLNIRKWQDWYRVTLHDIVSNGGSSLLNHFGNSPSKLITTLLPEHPWNLYDFESVPVNYWKDRHNQKAFLNELTKRLEVNNYSDWYKVTVEDIQNHGGNGILWNYDNSPAKMIMSILQEFPWKPFMFRQRHFKYSDKQAKIICDELALYQNIFNPLDWRKVSVAMMKETHGGASLLSQTGSVKNALKLAYPSTDWESVVSLQISRPQHVLLKMLKKLVPDVLVNHRHPQLRYANGKKMELDFYSPSLNLGIEYQGQHHYIHLWERCESPASRSRLDNSKAAACSEAGISLVAVPFWWDQTEAQLVDAIRKVKPNLMSSETRRDSLSFTEQFTSGYNTKAQALALGNDYASLGDPADWWITEKLNGYRGYWDGKSFFSRHGHPTIFRNSIQRKLPNGTPLDGELWVERSSFFECQLALSAPATTEKISFRVFDTTF